jgi:hypothetical protein
MIQSILKNALFVGIAVMLLSFDLPTGWFIAGSTPSDYEMGIDKGAGSDGKNAATIKSIGKKVKGFGTLMQDCLPDQYIGKRIRLSGKMKTKDVSGWAGFWLRLDEKETMNCLGFDNMKDGKKDRSITGTTEWNAYEIVLDVPEKTGNIAFGALLDGSGQIWFDDMNIEIVDESVPTTGTEEELSHVNKVPTNLDFED